ncbi:MAG: DNA repair protein RecO [Microthrixaceae bacterium]
MSGTDAAVPRCRRGVGDPQAGEADRIVVLCTKRHGKVRAVAHGVRKTGSRFGSRLEPASHVVVQLYEGRNLDTVNQAELVESSAPIRGDLDRLGRAAAMLEVVDHIGQEGHYNPRLYEMLVGGLRAVAHHDSPLVTASFLLRLLDAEGVGLRVDRCVECGATDSLVSVDLGSGGLRCAEHRQGAAIGDQAVRILQLILGGRIAAALTLPVGAATFEVDNLATAAMERHLDRRLRSLHLLDRG